MSRFDEISSGWDRSRLRVLKLSREELDNPHKESTWKVYREDFSVQVLLEIAPEEENVEADTAFAAVQGQP